MKHSPPGPDDVLRALRDATSAAHLELERTVRIEQCVAALTAYRRLLESFHGFYQGLETCLFGLDGWREAGLDLTARRKTPWIDDDLSALGMTAQQIGSLPVCAALPSTRNLAQGFGCLYVLEGATLGGRQIMGLLQNSPVPTDARRFFGSYGTETGSRWKEFIAAMNAYARRGGEEGRAEIVRAAEQTFACLQRWIVEHSPQA